MTDKNCKTCTHYGWSNSWCTKWRDYFEDSFTCDGHDPINQTGFTNETKAKTVDIKLRCPRCGSKASIGVDDRGEYGWCHKEKKTFSVRFT